MITLPPPLLPPTKINKNFVQRRTARFCQSVGVRAQVSREFPAVFIIMHIINHCDGYR